MPPTTKSSEWSDEIFLERCFQGNGSNWLVKPPLNHQYMWVANTLFWTLSLHDSDLEEGSTELYITLPAEFPTLAPPGSFVTKPGYVYCGGAQALDFALQVHSGTQVVLHRGGAGIPAGLFQVYFTMVLSLGWTTR